MTITYWIPGEAEATCGIWLESSGRFAKVLDPSGAIIWVSFSWVQP